ncbi:RNA polymerase sigma factor [Clostridium culturomicium]|uniref:hypothetical protein n=1 Tax=Clostridium culturomicium TaxID=1499683 RepID=UPI003857B037
MIDFKSWRSKVGYEFSGSEKDFQIYLYYLLHMPRTDDKKVMVDYLATVNVPKHCKVTRSEMLSLFNKAYDNYVKDFNLIRVKTLTVLNDFKKLKAELKSCDGNRAREIRYWLTALGGALKNLNAEQQAIISYRYFEKMKVKDIAPLIGRTSTGSVYMKCEHAIESIEEILFDMYDIHKWNI